MGWDGWEGEGQAGKTAIRLNSYFISHMARKKLINPLAPELFFFLILAHPVHKMWIIQEPNKLALWNKLHFEDKKT